MLGSAVNLAKRLESSAPVDGILISQRTRDLIAPFISTRLFGEIQVKGLGVPVRAYEVAELNDLGIGAMKAALFLSGRSKKSYPGPFSIKEFSLVNPIYLLPESLVKVIFKKQADANIEQGITI